MPILKGGSQDDLTLKYLLENNKGGGGSGGDSGVTDVLVDGTSVVTDKVAEIDLTGKSDVGHTHTVSDITDFPILFPVGAIYISVDSTSPASLFGGTWARITGKFLLAATDGGAQGGNSNASIEAGYTGGEAEHLLTTTEMPSHTHRTNIRNQGSGGGTTTHGTWGTSGTDNITSGSAGGNGAHNTMPPYLAVYVWERTA